MDIDTIRSTECNLAAAGLHMTQESPSVSVSFDYEPLCDTTHSLIHVHTR